MTQQQTYSQLALDVKHLTAQQGLRVENVMQPGTMIIAKDFIHILYDHNDALCVKSLKIENDVFETLVVDKFAINKHIEKDEEDFFEKSEKTSPNCLYEYVKIFNDRYLNKFKHYSNINNIILDDYHSQYNVVNNMLIKNNIIVQGTLTSNLDISKIDTIGELSFAFLNISSIDVSNNIQLIDKYAFKYSSLKKIILLKNVYACEEESFSYCLNLTDIDVYDINIIKESCFYKSYLLSNINCENIDTYDKNIEAFSFCYKIEKINGKTVKNFYLN